jgi:ribosomal-protein-alanine N-acetyltransferase
MMQIGEGSAADIDAVMEVMTNAFDPTYGEAWTRNQLLSALAIAGTKLTLARRENQMVGFALTRTIIDETELLMIGVHRQWQRNAIASQLLSEILRAEVAKENSRVFLEVRSNNHARQLYRTIGFSEVGIRSNYYRGANNAYYDAITMAYDLQEEKIDIR